MTKEKNKKKSLRSLVTTCFFILILAGSFLFGKDSLAVPNNYTKNATSTLVAAEWNNLISDFVNTFGTSTMVGPIGIGTTAPRAGLEVSSNISQIRVSRSDALSYYTDIVEQNNSSYPFYINTNNYGRLMGYKLLIPGNQPVAFMSGYYGVALATYSTDPASTNVRLYVNQIGNVGIGTTDQNDIFSIGNSGSAPAGSSNTGHNFTSTYLNSDDYALVNYGLAKTLIASATSSISNLWAGSASSSIWNLNTGNTGIGTTTPLFKFEVNGTFKVSTSSSSIILDSGGNVLIGI